MAFLKKKCGHLRPSSVARSGITFAVEGDEVTFWTYGMNSRERLCEQSPDPVKDAFIRHHRALADQMIAMRTDFRSDIIKK